MQSIVHKTVESMTQALGPIFRETSDWETIRLATVMVMARVIQATPYKGKELEIFDATANDILHALEQLLKIEEAEKAKLKSTIAAGIDAFDSLGESDSIGPALVAIEKAAEEKGSLTFPYQESGVTPEQLREMSRQVSQEHLTLGAQEPAPH